MNRSTESSFTSRLAQCVAGIPSLGLVAVLAAVPLLHGCFVAAVAGAGTAVMVAEDRRSTGTIVEDQNIELKANAELGKKYGKNDVGSVKVVSFNRYVLLCGEVPTQAVKDGVGAVVAGIQNVRNVQNELVVGPSLGISQATSDTATTAKVKSRFVTENRFQANHIKVVTRNGVVYLMGLVTAQEADDATEIARTTGGVSKVVRVFELMQKPA